MFKVTAWIGNENHPRVIHTDRETAMATADYWLTALGAIGVTITKEV